MLSDRDCDYNTPLHLAVENGHYEVVKLCLQKRASINTPADNYMYPLHLAAKAGDVKVVKILVDSGARIDVRNIEMSTPLHIASQYNHKDIVDFILKQYVINHYKSLTRESSLKCHLLYGYKVIIL